MADEARKADAFDRTWQMGGVREELIPRLDDEQDANPALFLTLSTAANGFGWQCEILLKWQITWWRMDLIRWKQSELKRVLQVELQSESEEASQLESPVTSSCKRADEES